MRRVTACVILLMAAARLRGDQMSIVSVTEDLMVRRGDSVNMTCLTDQEWFFCLWRHPLGIKECSIQEEGGYRSVCTGQAHVSLSSAGPRSCSVRLEDVQAGDRGRYMCLLNQADLFHTDRRYVNLDVATPATLRLGRVTDQSDPEYQPTQETQEVVQELGVLSLVAGQEVRLGCEATGAWPKLTFLWSLPGLESLEIVEEDLEARTLSSILYTARSEDQGAVVRCSGVQESPGGKILYKVSTNFTLEVTRPQPLLASRSGQLMGVITGGLLALVLVISILGVTLAVWKKKKRLGGSGDRATSNKVSASETSKDVEKIWVTKSSLKTQHRDSVQDSLQTSVEVHNSSASSATSSSSSNSRSSSHEGLSPHPKREINTRKASEVGQGEYISYSPAYMYSSYEATQLNPGPYRSYRPRGLGHFDPSTDVHSVTRPGTGHSLLTFQPQTAEASEQESQQGSTLVSLQFPSRPRPLRIYTGDQLSSGPGDVSGGYGGYDPEISVEEAVTARSGEERTGVTSQTGTGESTLNRNSNESNKNDTVNHFEIKEASKEPVTPGSCSRSLHGLGASSHSLVPVNIPIDIENDPIVMEILGEQPIRRLSSANQRTDNYSSANQRPDNLTGTESQDNAETDPDSTGDYQEMYHTSMGHLFTVKTKDMEL